MTSKAAPPSSAIVPNGFVVFRASRLEALIGPLATMLDTLTPDHPLAAQRVLTGHPGMRRWLPQALLHAAAADAVVANIEFVLPSAWIDELAQRGLGAHAVGLPQWQREHLRWAIFELLDQPGGAAKAEDPIAAWLAGYLAERDDPRAGSASLRRLKLAERLAAMYARHMLYRPDWLRGDRRGASSALSPALAAIWHQLRARLGAHRGEVIAELAKHLDTSKAPLEPLHVFGLNHLAPPELDLLARYARHAPVLLYLFDPSHDCWFGLPPDQNALRRFLHHERAHLDGEPVQPLPSGHPLLERLGKLGRHFMAALAEAEVVFEVRDHQDPRSPEPNRLGLLQQGIRDNQLRGDQPSDDQPSDDQPSDDQPSDDQPSDDQPSDNQLGDNQPSDRQLRDNQPSANSALREALAARADASLRIHACHTRVRELEVLRDALLDALADGIAPEDMVVMAPDIQRYAPLLAAVFGEPGAQRGRHLAYHLADTAAAETDETCACAKRLLAAADARIGIGEVRGLLLAEPIRTRLGLSADDAQLAGQWLTRAGAAWALDADDRAGYGLPAQSAHSMTWARDRLLLGFLAGADRGTPWPEPWVGEPADNEPPTPISPLPGIDAPGARVIGAIDVLLDQLAGWRRLAGASMTASAWQVALTQRYAALLDLPAVERGDSAGAALLRRALAALAAEPALVGADPLLAFDAVREVLLTRLDALPARQRFLSGGVSFCGMVPQRAIPFALIAVLGLDEGALPRADPSPAFDPMRAKPRVGDRAVVDDDRYLFLETLMAARQRLHLSWLGQDELDGRPRSPAAPLVDLLDTLDALAGIDPDAELESERAWLVRHPLMPFDARYFDNSDRRDVALFSHTAAFAALEREPSPSAPSPNVAPPGAVAQEAVQAPAELALARLSGYFRSPSKVLLRQLAQVSLDGLAEPEAADDVDVQRGPFAQSDLLQNLFARELLPSASVDALDAALKARLIAAGQLPAAAHSAAGWEAIRQTLDAALSTLRGVAGGGSNTAIVRTPVAITLAIGATTVRGTIETCLLVNHTYCLPQWLAADGRSLKALRPHLGVRAPWWIDYAALRLSLPAATGLRLVALGGDGDTQPEFVATVNAWDQAWCGAETAARDALSSDLRLRLAALIAHWHCALASPGCYFPRTSSALASDGDVAEAWREERQGSGRSHWLLARDLDPEGADHARLAREALAIDAAVDLGLTEAAA